MSDQIPNGPQPETPVPGVTQDEKTMALLAHLLGLITCVIGR